MATNHTENYNLNLWAPTDTFLRTEFNENTQKLDAALGSLSQTVSGKADASTVTALSQTVAQKADTSALDGLIVTGSAGVREYSRKTIDLGFHPRLVFLFEGRRIMEVITRFTDLRFVTTGVSGSSVTTGICLDSITTSGISIAGSQSAGDETSPTINYVAFR